MRYGMIAGNGRFPLLALESARKLGHEVIAVGIEGEAPAAIEQLAARTYWIGIGQLSKLIEILQAEKVSEVIMAGQVKHVSIFSGIRPDWRLFKLLASLKEKNTDALIGGVARVLEEEGIRLADSTLLLKPLLAGEGTLTKRKPTAIERKDVSYGQRIAGALAALDVGQCVALSDGACVALEGMEGTDAMLRRAQSLVNGSALTLVKVSRRRKHLLFDVPVVGPTTVEVMRETGTTMLAIDAGRTLMLDRDEMLSMANDAHLAIVGYPPPADGDSGGSPRVKVVP